MRVTIVPVTTLVPGDLVTLDGTLPALTVVKVGKGNIQRNVTYRRADGEEFRITHTASGTVERVTVEPSEQPVGADVLVSTATGGYRGRVERTDRFGRTPVVNGRSRWFLQAQDRVQVLALDGSSAALEAGDEAAPSAWYDEPVTGLHLEDGLCCAEDDHEGAAPAAEQPQLAQLGDAPPVWLLVVEDGGVRREQPYADLPVALDGWRAVLAARPLADITLLRDGKVYATVEEYDTCTIHRDAVFTKDGPCPVCAEYEALWEDDPAAAEAEGDSATAAVLRGLLKTYDARDGVLTTEERAALEHAIYVLEG